MEKISFPFCLSLRYYLLIVASHFMYVRKYIKHLKFRVNDQRCSRERYLTHLTN